MERNFDVGGGNKLFGRAIEGSAVFLLTQHHHCNSSMSNWLVVVECKCVRHMFLNLSKSDCFSARVP